MNELEKKWYVLRTISGKEKKIMDFINNEIKRLNISNNLSQVLLPREKVFQIRNGKKIVKEKVFFPGYILIEGILNAETYYFLRNIPGIINILGSKDNPIPLKSNEIQKILGKIDELYEKEEQVKYTYIVGENIKVIDGPFNSFSGTIEEINEEKKKVKVIVKIFGRKTPLELNFMQIEKE